MDRRRLPDGVDALEDALFEDRPDRDFLREIYALRRAVMRLARIASPQRDAVRRLAVLSADVAPQSEHLFVDIADRLTYVAAQIESLRQRLDTAFDHYQSTVANAQNEVMKVLTVVAAILLPLTVVTGIYGMNFQHMPELDEPWAYPAVLGLIAGIVGGALLLFRAKGWIGSGRSGRRPGARVARKGRLR